MILKVIMVKLKTVLSLVLVPLRASLFFFTQLWRTVQFFIGYLLQLLFNVDLRLRMFLGVDLMSFSFAPPEPNILDTDHSEIPHKHKCAHIIALDDGNYAAQPNNRCIWDIPSFTVKDEIPKWKVQTSEWNVENTSKWKTADTDDFFYEIEEKKHDE
jgi:hypothetical protein